MKKLRTREVKKSVQGHTVTEMRFKARQCGSKSHVFNFWIILSSQNNKLLLGEDSPDSIFLGPDMPVLERWKCQWESSSPKRHAGQHSEQTLKQLSTQSAQCLCHSMRRNGFWWKTSRQTMVFLDPLLCIYIRLGHLPSRGSPRLWTLFQ